MKRSSTTSLLTVTALAVSLAALGGQALAADPALTDVHTIRHLDLAAGEQPENLAVERDGSLDLTMSFARSIERLTPDGHLTTLATLPAPPGGTDVPLIGRAFVGGVVMAPDGTRYVTYAAGTDALTGVWQLPRHGAPRRVAALPAAAVPNGLALYRGRLYVSDSALGAVWRVPLGGGTATVWSQDPELAGRPGKFGANGLKVHHGAVWVGNFDRGTLLRIPVRHDGTAGRVHLVADGLGPVDDFDFTGHGDDALVSTNPGNEVELVRGDGSHRTVLTAADGLQNPTAVAVRGDRVYVTDAAYFTAVDPNIVGARLHGRH
ncbi:hypothetical protein C3492_05320 [Streptomyces sp. Ru62]|uniref:hypothetical protein n=1 Tax=Streptomyces sp. Ru62 TaxID=2080745 RepID=UPI000CDDB457|nr:hypothetical protein [Streptomyces sp. Ru62]POX64455.1 hypothetical protein C3492_05320 [Streptomyces sp. Ru62]